MFNPYMNPMPAVPYNQQLDAIKQQLLATQQQQYQQPYQQPYQPQQQTYQQPYQPQQQIQQPQIPNFQLMIQQEIQRQLSGFQQQQALPPPAPPVPPATAILSAIGGVMNELDQRWLSANLNGLPAFFNTSDGRELVQLAISSYKKHCGVNDD